MKNFNFFLLNIANFYRCLNRCILQRRVCVIIETDMYNKQHTEPQEKSSPMFVSNSLSNHR